MKRAHRHRDGTDAHVTADRSDGAGRRPRHTKPMSEGGTRPDLAPCKTCGAQVIHHKLSGDRPILLDPAELKHGDDGARHIIMGTVIPDPDPRNVPADIAYHRKHTCAPRPPAPPEP